MSLLSPVLHAAPVKAIIIPIDLDDASAFPSENTPDVPAVLVDQADRSEPSPSPALSISWTSRERPLLLGLGIVVFAIAGVATSVVAMAALDDPPPPQPPTGAVTITSEPSGSPVTIDGEMRGSTPLATILTAGSHVVAVGTGTQVPRRLEVPRGGDVRLHVQSQLPTEPQISMASSTVNAPIATAAKQATTRTDKPGGLIETPARAAATGWLAVSSTFPVQILDDGREVGTSTNAAVALPAGDRTVVLVNAALEFREERHVKVLAQKKTLLTVDRPNGILHVNARPWAEVWIDGRRIGETPLGNISVPIGEHEVVFRHPGQPEKLTTVTVGARSATRVTTEFQP